MSSLKDRNMHCQTICHHLRTWICIVRLICHRYRAAIWIIRPICHPETVAIYINYVKMPLRSRWFTIPIEIQITMIVQGVHGFTKSVFFSVYTRTKCTAVTRLIGTNHFFSRFVLPAPTAPYMTNTVSLNLLSSSSSVAAARKPLRTPFNRLLCARV